MTAFGLQVSTKEWGLLVHGGISKPDSNRPKSAFFSLSRLNEETALPSSENYRLISIHVLIYYIANEQSCQVEI